MNKIFDHIEPLDPTSAAVYDAARAQSASRIDEILDQDRALHGEPEQCSYANPIQVCPGLIELLRRHPERYVMPIERPYGDNNEQETLDRFHLCISREGLVVIDRGEAVIEWDWAYTSILPVDISAQALACWLTTSSVQELLARMLIEAKQPAGSIRSSERLYGMVSDLPRVNRLAFNTVCEMFEMSFDMTRCHEPLTAAELMDEVVIRGSLAPNVVHIAPPDCLQRMWKPFLVDQFLHMGLGLPYTVVNELHEDGLLDGQLIDQLARNAMNLLDPDTVLDCIENGAGPDVRAANRQPAAHVMRTAEQLIKLRDLGGDVFARDNLDETALARAEMRFESEGGTDDQRIVTYLRAVRDQQALAQQVPPGSRTRARRLM